MTDRNHHGMKDLRGTHAFCQPGAARSDRFGRLFPDLPPHYVDPRALQAVGAAGGPMSSTGRRVRTKTVAVGQVFFGQFVDHDITLDLTSSFARLDAPSDTPNFRTPTLDLDCVYGDGPEGSPYLFRHGRTGADAAFNGAKLLVGADDPGASAEARQDLVRSLDGRAIIGDPRNDENRVVSQLQLAMLRFHNRVCDELHASRGLEGEGLFAEARRVVTWHYQWAVLFDFLPAMCGQAVVADILQRGRRLYPSGEPFIPVEFSAAAYRFGHSMVPLEIQVQPGKPSLELFGPTLGRGFAPLDDLDAVVDWNQLLDLGDPTVDRAERLDTTLAPILLALPFVQPPGEPSLATRNLLRGQAFRLPAGERIAMLIGRPEAEIDGITKACEDLARRASTTFGGASPLWLYVLAEAAVVGRESAPGVFEKGEGLGPVGARIVAETLIGILDADGDAWLGSNRSWSPDGIDRLGAAGVHTVREMLTF